VTSLVISLKLIPVLPRKIFPHKHKDPAPVVNSALARIKAKRRGILAVQLGVREDQLLMGP